MMPGDQVTKYIRRTTAAGAAVTGKVTADFVFRNSYRPNGGAVTTWSAGDAIVEIGGGWYSWTFTMIPSAGQGFNSIDVASGTDIVNPNSVQGECEAQDSDSIYAAVAQPAGLISLAALLGSPVPLSIVPYRYRQITIQIKDQAGAVVDLSGYTNWRLATRSLDHTTTKWWGSNGSPTGFAITGDASGNLAITLPESVKGPQYLTWVTAFLKVKGDYVVPTALNGYIYEATAVTTGITAGVEPTWPTTVGNSVVDGGVTWTCRNKTIWTVATAKVVGDSVTPTTANGFTYKCIVAGTTHASVQPTWPTTPGNTVVDQGVTWECQSDFYAALASDTTPSLDLYYEIVADKGGQSNQSQTIVPSSILTLKRREDGT